MQFHCQGCGRKVQVADEAAGRRGYCPYCKTVQRVPKDEQHPKAPPTTKQTTTLHETGYSVIALFAVLVVIVVVEHLIEGHLHFDTTKLALGSLEFIAVSVLIASFINGEILKALTHVFAKEKQHLGLKAADIFNVFAVITTSLVIFLVFTWVLALSPESDSVLDNPATSHPKSPPVTSIPV